MGTVIFKMLLWLAWQGMKVVHLLLKPGKVRTKVIHPVLDAAG